ncbi:MAG: extracellular solute-binding protein [Eubacteriales bacterium]|nr:extracellular solute-binding protein [Eubacteriales bacterium]
MKKRIISVWLSLAISATVIAGCANQQQNQDETVAQRENTEENENEEAAEAAKTELLEQDPEEMAKKLDDVVLPTPDMPLVDEPITLSVLYPKETLHGNFEDMFYMKAVQELTNIELDVQAIEKQAWTEKVGLMFASGDYGDIFLAGINFTDAAAYGQAGMLLPLEELLEEYAPNAMKILDELLPESRRNVTADDGHIYAMPAYDGTPRDMLMNYTQMINYDWMNKAGIEEMPETTEDMYQVLKAFKASDPNGNGKEDEIPYSKVYDGDGYDPFISAFGFVNLRHDIIDGEYVYVPAEENFRHYLEYMNRLYEEGLIDPEMFTQTEEDYLAKRTEKLVGVGDSLQDPLSYEEYEATLKTLSPMTSEYNAEKMTPGRFQEVNSYSLCITDKCDEEKAIAAVKLLDYFYSQEGTYLIKCGPEAGVWGDLVDGGYVRNEEADGTVSYELEYDREKYNDSYYNFRMENGLMIMPFFYTNAHAQVIVGSDRKNARVTEGVYEAGLLEARRVGFPTTVTFTEDEQDILATFVLMDNYVDQMVAKFITGEEALDDANWNAYLERLESMDLQMLKETRQSAYDRWINKAV